MRDDFAVRIRRKRYSFFGQFGFEFFGVAYHAVVRNGDFAVERQMRVCVFLAYLAVSCPPRMPDSRLCGKGGNFPFEQFDAPDCFEHLDFLARNRGDTRAVIASIFKSFQSVKHDFLGTLKADVANNSAHIICICNAPKQGAFLAVRLYITEYKTIASDGKTHINRCVKLRKNDTKTI